MCVRVTHLFSKALHAFVVAVLLAEVSVPAAAHCAGECDGSAASPSPLPQLLRENIIPPSSWQETPDRIAVLTVAAHPDDEGIFFGGTLPYYAQVRNLPTAHISMTSGEFSFTIRNRPDDERFLREDEMRNAAAVYGLRHEPIFGRFVDGGSDDSPLVTEWDQYAEADINTLGPGNPVEFLAKQFRQLKPSVIATHDFGGEYGHPDHQKVPDSVIQAYAMAADANVVLLDDEGQALAPWQADKLYVHLYEFNRLIADVYEQSYQDLNGQTPRQVADLALDEHASQNGGNYQVESQYEPGSENNNSCGACSLPKSAWIASPHNQDLMGSPGWRITAIS